MRIRVWHGAESLGLALGVPLLVFYGAAMLHNSAGSRGALRSFEARQAAVFASPQSTAVDHSLWSEKRIKAYQDSLTLMKGEPVAVLTIDRLRIKAPVFAGTDDLVLNRGVGWIQGTAKLGDAGNCGIAGHRDGFFRPLKDVRVGDLVDVQTHYARLTYRVNEIEIVRPDNVGVLRSRGTASLTLVTCFPFYFVGDAPQRFIVHANLEKRVAVNSLRISGSPRTEAASPIQKEQINEYENDPQGPQWTLLNPLLLCLRRRLCIGSAHNYQDHNHSGCIHFNEATGGDGPRG